MTIPPLPIAEGVSSPARWSRDGRRIYYVRGDDTMMTLAVSTDPFKVGTPEPLFKLQRPARLQDVALDGRFLLLVAPGARRSASNRRVTAAIASTRQ